jgi:hypothetical protein
MMDTSAVIEAEQRSEYGRYPMMEATSVKRSSGFTDF